MPRIAGKAYPKPKKRDPKEPVWENGILCRRQGKRWTQGELAYLIFRQVGQGDSYQEIQKTLLRTEVSMRIKVHHSKKGKDGQKKPARARVGKKRAGKQPVKAPRAASRAVRSSRAAVAAAKTSRSASASSGYSSAPSAAVKASPPASPPAPKHSAEDREAADALVFLSGGGKTQQRLPEHPAPASTRVWPHSQDKCSIDFLTN